MAVEYIKYNFEANNAQLLKALNEVDKGFSKLDKLGTYTSNVSKQFDKLTNSFKKTSKQGNILHGVLVGISGIQIGKWLAEGTKQAIDYVETLNLFTVAMKDSYDAGMQFVNMMSEMYGLDPKEVMDSVGLFYEMGYAVGMPDEAAQKMSLTMAALSNDVASLFNYDIAQTSDNMISGLRGMSRAVVKYGMDLRATTVEQYAISKGLDIQFESLNEASRELLRFLTVIEQTEDAQGDFARTIEQPANQLRILKAQVTQVARAIGNVFLGALDSILYKIVGVTMAIKVMIEVFATLLGINYEPEAVDPGFGDASNVANDYANSVVGIGSAASDAKKKLDSLVAPFDELNILQENASSGATGGAGAGVDWGAIDPELLKLVDEVDYKLANIRLKAQDVKEAILGFMGISWDENTQSWVYSADEFERRLKAALPGLQQTITAIFDVDWGLIGAQLNLIFAVLKQIASLALDKVADDFERIFGVSIDEALASFFTNLSTSLGDFTQYLIENQDMLSTVVARIIEFGLAWLAVQNILIPVVSLFAGIVSALTSFASLGVNSVMSVVTAFGSLKSFILAVTKVLTGTLTPLGLGAITALVAGFIAGFAQLWENSQQFRDNIAQIFSNIGVLIGDIVNLVSDAVSAIIKIVTPIVSVLGNLLQPVVILVTNIINAIIGAVDGLVIAIDGILTGDLTLVFKGFFKVLVSLVEAVMNAGAFVINGVLSAIFSAINFVGNLIYTFICGVIDAANNVSELVGVTIEKPDKGLFVFEDIPQIVPPSFDYAFATGGVVTGPTRALIGEGRYDEAVIPLGESPQLQELVEKIGQRVESGSETVVKVYIGDKEWDTFTYQSAKRGESLVGAQPIKSYG